MSVDIAAKVRGFILEELSWEGRPESLTEDFPLLEKRVLDSLAIVQIVTMLEDEFGAEIDDDELIAENFATIGSIERLVQRKTVSSA